MSEPTISVIIPAHNCENTITKTLEAIATQDVLTQIEIIVVDDGSIDQTASIVRSFPKVKYLRQENSGPATARNLGARSATGNYLFFTDSDCIPQKDWVKKMMPHFTDEKTAVVAGSYGIANPEKPLARCIHQEIRYRHNRMPQNPSYFGSFNFAIRREIFKEVGGFDASYRKASGEDNDLSYQIIARNYKIYFAKDALVDHSHPERIGKYLREQSRHGFWRAKMYLRHPKMSRGDDYTFWKDIVEVPLVLLLLMLAFLGLFNTSFIKVLGGVAGAVSLLEIYYSLAIIKNGRLKIFWAFVMFARAVARSLGFVAGFFRFLPAQIFSK